MSYYYKDYGLQSPLKRAKNTGSAKSGAKHWWHLKLASLALIPLSLWLFFSLVHMFVSQMHYPAIIEWVAQPLNTILLSLFVLIGFYHAAIGGQEVIVDYIKDKKLKVTSLILYYFANFAGATVGLYAILRIALIN